MSRRSLAVIYDDIAARAGAIASAHGAWPCRRGCDDCCRALAAPPTATRAEWERLWPAFLALPPEQRAEIRARVSALAQAPREQPSVCPLLDRHTGACLVYADRPAACRTYGFYAARDGGRWCHRIETIATTDPTLVWGNHAAVDRDLETLSGAPIDLTAWFAAHPEPGRPRTD